MARTRKAVRLKTESILMADFCYECTAELFGSNYAKKNDFANLVSLEEHVQHGLVAHVLCESCGEIEVDHLGRRIENA